MAKNHTVPLLSIKTVFTVQWRFRGLAVIHISKRGRFIPEELFASVLRSVRLVAQIDKKKKKVNFIFNRVNRD